VTQPPPTTALKNQILLQLRDGDRDALLDDAEHGRLPVGDTFAGRGDDTSSVYFPETGVISLVSEMKTGHQVAVSAVGSEGVVGLASVLDVPRFPHRVVVLVESEGHRVPANRLRGLFDESEAVRRVMLRYIGQSMTELMVTAACYRVHSHRQRLARWLLMTADKAGLQSLSATHETLAQMVGGPRHAVTRALNELRAKGVIAHLRGRVDIIRRSGLVAEACECYRGHGQAVP
jgi:CRP-like cAMP-binding protein